MAAKTFPQLCFSLAHRCYSLWMPLFSYACSCTRGQSLPQGTACPAWLATVDGIIKLPQGPYGPIWPHMGPYGRIIWSNIKVFN